MAQRLGFRERRQTGSHVILEHTDRRRAVIPVHGDSEISGPVYYAILKQLGITEEEFRRLK